MICHFFGDGYHIGPSISPVPGLTIKPGELEKKAPLSGWQEPEGRGFQLKPIQSPCQAARPITISSNDDTSKDMHDFEWFMMSGWIFLRDLRPTPA